MGAAAFVKIGKLNGMPDLSTTPKSKIDQGGRCGDWRKYSNDDRMWPKTFYIVLLWVQMLPGHMD